MPVAAESAPPGHGIPTRSADEPARDVAAPDLGHHGPDPLPDLDPELNPLIARAYSAADRGAAAVLYSREAPALSKLGYVPASERWEETRVYRGSEETAAAGTLWVTYLAKAITLPPRVCSFCGSELPG